MDRYASVDDHLQVSLVGASDRRTLRINPRRRDKFLNRLADWGMYLSPLATYVIPFNAEAIMHVVGVVEIVAGLIVFSRWTKDGFLKFDANGNAKMVELLKSTNKTDHFRVKVSGPIEREVLKVESLSLQ